MMRKNKVLGIMGAMPEEIDGFVHLLSDVQKSVFGKRTYYTGFWNDMKVVVVFSRWGKVAAATTVATLIHEFGVNELLFTGVAGAIHDDLKIGDVVVAQRLIQHDLDGQPLMKKFEIPLLGKTFIDAPADQLHRVSTAISPLFVNGYWNELLSISDFQEFKIGQPKLHFGDVASGDQFFSSHQQKVQLTQELPSILCVEMEGAAVAQVCYEYNVPFTIIRTISDESNEQSHIDFASFIKNISNKMGLEMVRCFLQSH